MIALNRRSMLLAAAAVIAALAALAMTIGAPSAQSASSTCRLSESEQYPKGPKPTYNLSLKVRSTSCVTAKKVMNAFHKCRSAKGYRCTKKVLRAWSCAGRKDSSTPLLFYGSFTCTQGAHRVESSYQQNTE